MSINYTPIGCPTLDLLCGGGVPHESLIYLYGGPGLGKTTIALAMLAAVGSGVWVDAGHSLVHSYAGMQGCTDMTVVYPTDTIDIGATIIPLIGLTPLIVVDDLTSLSVGLARPLEALIKKVVRLLPDSGTTILMTNHVRYCRNGYRPPGGLSPIKYGHLVLELGPHSSRIGDLVKVDVKIIKSVVGPYQGTGTIPFRYGLDRIHDTITTAIKVGVVVQVGSWYYYKDIKIQGLENLCFALSNSDIGAMYLEVMKALGYSLNT